MAQGIALPPAAAVASAVLAMALAGPAPATTNEDTLRATIRSANASSTLDELNTVVRNASTCCKASPSISRELSHWLRESHPIYSGRLPTDARQFRGFLLASLGAFVPNDELYGYVKSEFHFGGHAFDIAAAAVASRSFAARADELLPLMEPYLGSAFDDAWVDLTTPELSYPLRNPTRARHEIIRTLIAFAPSARRSLPYLDAIARCPDCGTYAADTALPRKATEAAQVIRELASSNEWNDSLATIAAASAPRLIDERQRRRLATNSLKLVDHDGRSLEFADLRGRPFVLTFFYSQCPNQTKCALTVQRLGSLAAACREAGLSGKVGIYGMTYDPKFDRPSILKRYGSMYGMKFEATVRLFTTTDSALDALRDELALRVSYGAGSVNQHGIQLFVFDRRGRLAATYDNELWTPTDVRNVLSRLAEE